MKGTSKVIMGATLVMVVSLAMVLGLILVLLAELYCSLLLRHRRRLRTTTATDPEAAAAADTASAAAPPQQPHQNQSSSSDDHHPPATLGSLYAHGVLQAPRSLLFPAISFKEDCIITKKRLSNKLHNQGIDIDVQSPPPQQQEPEEPAREEKAIVDDPFVYISNPMYENAETRPNTPFETPDTSPSRLEMAESGSGEDDDEAEKIDEASPLSSPSSPLTPPLTPMKKLPPEACSVSLRDARSLATSGSDSNSNNGRSSSSSASPCTSPSW